VAKYPAVVRIFLMNCTDRFHLKQEKDEKGKTLNSDSSSGSGGRVTE